MTGSIGNRIKKYLKRYKTYGVLLATCAIVAFVCQVAHSTRSQDMDIARYEKELKEKVVDAGNRLDELENAIVQDDKASEQRVLEQVDEDVLTLAIYEDDELKKWSSNRLLLPIELTDVFDNSDYVKIGSTWCVPLRKMVGNKVIVALVYVRTEHDINNEWFEDQFAKGFVTDGVIASKNQNMTWVEWTEVISLGALLLLILFGVNYSYKWLFNWHRMPGWYFITLFLLTGIGIELLFTTGAVGNFAPVNFFSPLYYASGEWMTSLGQMFVLSAFVFFEILFFFQNNRLRIGHRTAIGIVNHGLAEKNDKGNCWGNGYFLLLHIVSMAMGVGLTELIANVVQNSPISFSVNDVNSIRWTNVVTVVVFLFLFLSAAMARHEMVTCYIKKRWEKSIMSIFVISDVAVFIIILLLPPYYEESLRLGLVYLGTVIVSDFAALQPIERTKHKTKLTLLSLPVITLLVAIYSFYMVVLVDSHTQEKQMREMELMANNIEDNELLDRNVFTEMMLKELDQSLSDDDSLALLHDESSIRSHIKEKHLKNFWNNYVTEVHYIPLNTTTSQNSLVRHLGQVMMGSEMVAGTNFGYCRGRKEPIDYLGRYALKGNGVVYITLREKGRLRSFSFPERLLKEQASEDLGDRDFSMARYVNGERKAMRGGFRYPIDTLWFKVRTDHKPMFRDRGHRHYIHQSENGDVLVISERMKEGETGWLFFWVSVFVTSMGVLVLTNLGNQLTFRDCKRKKKRRLGIVGKQMVAFFSIMLLSFAAIGWITFNYSSHQYEMRQTANLRNRTHYIQKQMQQAFRDSSAWHRGDANALQYELQDIATTYESDVHLYDSAGHFVSSSLLEMANKGLIANVVNPSIMTRNDDEPHIFTEQVGKLKYYVGYARVMNKERKTLGFVSVPSAMSYAVMRNEVSSLFAITISVYLAFLLLSSFVFFYLNSRIAAPLTTVSEGLSDMRLQKANKRIELKTQDDEIGRIVRQYNNMVDRLDEAVTQLAKSERQTAWKQMARQVTHEIKNPLTPMRLTLQMMIHMKKQGGEEFDTYFNEHAPMLIEQIDTLAHIATSFGDFAKMPEAQRERVNVVEAINNATTLFQSNSEGVKVTQNIQVDDPTYILVDKRHLSQVLSNLVKNAIQSIPSDRQGDVRVLVQKGTQDENAQDSKTVRIDVVDNGIGVASDIKDDIFTPNFTTKTSGSGLGLAIVKNIVETNEGNISFTSVEGKGTTFTVTFPIID